MHSLQLWVNLPAADKMVEPRTQNLVAADLPLRREQGAEIRVFSRKSGDVIAPTKNYSPVTMVDRRHGVDQRETGTGKKLIAEVDVGLAANYLVVQYQTYLAQARSTEVAAKGAYAKAKLALDRATARTLDVNQYRFKRRGMAVCRGRRRRSPIHETRFWNVVHTERRGITQFDMVGFDIDSWG